MAGSLPLHADFSRRDPGRALAQAVQSSEYHYDEQTRALYVLRAAEVADLLVDPRLTSKRPKDRRLETVPLEYRDVQVRLKQFTSLWPIFLDGDLHSLVRKELLVGLQGAGDAYASARMSRRIAELLGPRQDETFDWIADFARPLSEAGIADLLRLSEHETAPLVAHARAIIDEMATPLMLHDRAVLAWAAVEHLREWLEQNTDRPDSPLIAGLAKIWNAPEAGPLAATAALTQVITGGLDPVVSLLGILAERLRPEPLETTDPAVLREEILRVASPFRFLPRYATCPMRIGDHEVRTDERVVLGLATANLDPAKWTAPHELVPRGKEAHYAFGNGDHYCTGAGYCRALVRAVIAYLSDAGVCFEVADLAREPELSTLRYRSMTGRLVRYRSGERGTR